MTGAVRAVLLDAAGTLFEERASRATLYAEALARHGAEHPETVVAGWMARAHDELRAPRPIYGRAWFTAFVGRVLGWAGCGADPGRVRAELEDVFLDPATYRVPDDVRPALARLSSAGLPLGLVSNWSERLPDLLEALELSSPFRVLAVSAVLDTEKPDPGPFRHALEHLDVEPSRALHVGDHPVNDLAGARAAGLAARLLDRAGRHPAEPLRLDDLLALCDELGV